MVLLTVSGLNFFIIIEGEEEEEEEEEVAILCVAVDYQLCSTLPW